jgi:hypothetical protein
VVWLRALGFSTDPTRPSFVGFCRATKEEDGLRQEEWRCEQRKKRSRRSGLIIIYPGSCGEEEIKPDC